MARYYGAPFLNLKPFDGPDPRNQTFRHPGDPVSSLDREASKQIQHFLNKIIC